MNYTNPEVNDMLPRLRDCCKLFVEFESNSGGIQSMDMDTRQTALGGIAMSLIQLQDGAEYFLRIVNMHGYPTTYKYNWETQVSYLSDQDYNLNFPGVFSTNCVSEAALYKFLRVIARRNQQ